MGATAIRDGLYLDDGLFRSYTVRPYVIGGLPAGLGQDREAVFGALPEKGDPDPLLPEAICVSRRIVRMVYAVDGTDPFDGTSGAVVLARAVFQSNNPFSGGGQAASAISVRYDRNIVVPNWTQGEPNKVFSGEWRWNPLQARRPDTIRVETRFLSGISIDVLQDAIESAIGKFWITPTDNILQFIGGRARASGTGQIVVFYQFISNGTIKAIPAGTIPGQDISVPELPPLHEYVYDIKQEPPVVGVAPIETFVEELGTGELPDL